MDWTNAAFQGRSDTAASELYGVRVWELVGTLGNQSLQLTVNTAHSDVGRKQAIGNS